MASDTDVDLELMGCCVWHQHCKMGFKVVFFLVLGLVVLGSAYHLNTIPAPPHGICKTAPFLSYHIHALFWQSNTNSTAAAVRGSGSVLIGLKFPKPDHARPFHSFPNSSRHII
jgi:hypothetical protein